MMMIESFGPTKIYHYLQPYQFLRYKESGSKQLPPQLKYVNGKCASAGSI